MKRVKDKKDKTKNYEVGSRMKIIMMVKIKKNMGNKRNNDTWDKYYEGENEQRLKGVMSEILETFQ